MGWLNIMRFVSEHDVFMALYVSRMLIVCPFSRAVPRKDGALQPALALDRRS